MREETIIRFLRKHKIDATCCLSCHEDENEGLGYLCELYFSKNRIAQVCCSVSIAFENLLKNQPKYKSLLEQ